MMQASAHLDSFARDGLPPPDQWPRLLLDGNPDVAYPARMNAASELLERQIRNGRGDARALHWLRDGRPASLSYRELAARVNRIAHVLRGPMGLVPGNRVLLRGPNTPMLAACWLAAVKAGLVTVPTMPLLRSRELRVLIDKTQVQAALCDRRLADELEYCRQSGHDTAGLAQIMYFSEDGDDLNRAMAGMPAEFPACDTAADDVCLVAFTSGTTGQPKACLHFHRDILAMCDTFGRHVLRLGPEDVVAGTPPLAFTFGLGGLLCFPLRAGASALLLDAPAAEDLLASVSYLGVTAFFAPPSLYRRMAGLAIAYPLSTLRICVSAGEALSEATRGLWHRATGLEITDGIGGTEMMHIYISSAPGQLRPGAIGQVVPGYEAQVVDEQLRPVAPGTVGRLAVRGPTGCRYLNDGRQTEFVQQGWNLPGDSFVMDEDGYFYYQARTDDMIVSSGYKIAAPQVEDALLEHEAVQECAVVASPDLLRGTVVHAYVVLNPGHNPGPELVEQLQVHVKARIAPYKYPRKISFVPELPRSETGKLQRFRLLEATSGKP